MYIYRCIYTHTLRIVVVFLQWLGFVPAEVETAPIAVALEAALPMYICMYIFTHTHEYLTSLRSV